MRSAHALAAAGAAALSLSTLAACGGSDAKRDPGVGVGAVSVTSTDGSCEISKKDLPAGKTVFKIANKGQKVTEVYVYAPGDKIVTERENIGPGTGVELTAELVAGKYQVACKPGMEGGGIRQDITVTGQAKGAADPRLTKAVTHYRAYVAAEVDDTLAGSRKFAASVNKGDVAGAKALYAPSRLGWEAIEPVAEAFGDIDPKVDLREKDLEKGAEWTGWHRLEKALWVKGSVRGEEKYADRLIKDLEDLKAKVPSAVITPTSMANGAKELLDEVATGKVTGEEEAFSHTDLVDFKGNVDGARKVFELLRPVVADKDADLTKTLDQEFATIETLLKKYEKGDGYVSYTTLGKAQVKELADAVNALGEPLSKLAGAVAE
ncbi:MAG: iron uptake system component EfeO [Streptosporangiaceae bacterium]|jgi:iron uptake system component EfeO|nr:iron uptake system component EfeO [Streptosporangiaceae bacterium]